MAGVTRAQPLIKRPFPRGVSLQVNLKSFKTVAPMFNLKILATSFLPLLPTLVSGYANPGACSGTCVNTHDPSIIRRSDGTYFRFSTGKTWSLPLGLAC